MGIFSDLEANALTIDFVEPRVGNQRADVQEIFDQRTRLGDIAYPVGYTAVDEEQEIPDVTADGGTYTITFNTYGGISFTTEALDFDADDSAIQDAVDTAAAVIADYTAGDIVIGGGSIDTAPITIAYTGASVSGKPQGLPTVTSSLTNSAAPVAAPVATEEVAGQTDRTPWALLRVLGVIVGPPPVQGTVSDVVRATTSMVNPHFPSQNLIRALAREAAAQDRLPAVEQAILFAVGLS